MCSRGAADPVQREVVCRGWLQAVGPVEAQGERGSRALSAVQPRSASAKSPDTNILLLDATKSSAIWSKSERQDLLIC